MRIQSIQQNNSTNFKSVYPVVHWVREAGERRYAPALSQELNEKLQRSLVRMLNSDEKKVKPEKLPFISKLKQLVSSGDKDFSNNSKARSFYNQQGGWSESGFEPFGYILTGDNAEHMSETLGKPIGRAKGAAPRLGDELAETAEVKISVNDYVKRGLNYVKKLSSRFRNDKKVKMGLHTKFKVIRTKNGKIKGFEFEDARFCPESGADNPFVKTGYIKQ